MENERHSEQNSKHVGEMARNSDEIMPRDYNDLLDTIASYAHQNPGLSLFHKDMDLPRWIIETASGLGLNF